MEFLEKKHDAIYPAIAPSNPKLSAEGKVVLITGGGSGIGKACATVFAQAGAKAICITGRTESTLAAAKDEISKAGSAEVHCVVADSTDSTSIGAAFTKMKELYGAVDVTIANAGHLCLPSDTASIDVAEFWEGFEVNTKGLVVTAKEFVKVADPGASFIYISSAVVNYKVLQGMASYAVSKLAGTKIVEFLQNDNPTLRFFSLHPGAVKTNMSARVPYIPAPDDLSLPGGFCLWLAMADTDFLKGRLAWAPWDVEELQAKAQEIEEKDLLRIFVGGHTLTFD